MDKAPNNWATGLIVANEVQATAADSDSAGGAESADHHTVRIWLFGGLSVLSAERPIPVRAPFGCSVRWLVAELGRHIESLDQIMETSTHKFNTCRLFLNGESVEMDDHLVATNDAEQDLELILFTAAEGG